MNGQVTIEFLINFLAIILFLNIVLLPLLMFSDNAKTRSILFKKMVVIEQLTRTLETHANSGIVMLFDLSIIEGYKVEQGKVHVDYQGKVIEIKGVFDGYNNSAQPV